MGSEKAAKETERSSAESVVTSLDPEREGPSGLLGLQASAGNRAVKALLSAQAALEVGRADDPFEREADAVAARVVEGLGAKKAGKAAAPAPSDIARSIRRLPATGAAAIGPEGGSVDAATEGALAAARGTGAALDPSIRREMEGAFGADFGAVRVHEGAHAAALSKRLGAKAFTLGTDIFFGGASPDAAKPDGQRLLAHELTHTVQQGAAPVSRVVQREGEEEGGGSGGEEGPAPGVLEGVSEDVDAEEVQKEGLQRAGPPEGIMEDKAGAAGRSRPTRGPRRAAPSGASGVRVNSSVGSSISISKSPSPLKSGRVSDSVTGSTESNFAMGGPGATMESKTALGEMDPKMKMTNITWKLNGSGAGRSVAISCLIDASADWCMNSRGKTNVPSGTDSVVTADNYAEIAADLTVAQKEKSWVPPRKKYWAQHLTERHEKVHATDFGSFITGGAKSFVKGYLDKQTLDIGDEEANNTASWFSWWSAPAKAAIQKKVDVLIRDTQRALNGAYSLYMFGPSGTTYHSQPTEEKAFGDGKKPYEELVVAVTKQGEQLEAAKPKATEPVVGTEPSTV